MLFDRAGLSCLSSSPSCLFHQPPSIGNLVLWSAYPVYIYTQYPLAQLYYTQAVLARRHMTYSRADKSRLVLEGIFWILYDELVSHGNQERGVRVRKYCEGQCDTDLLLLACFFFFLFSSFYIYNVYLPIITDLAVYLPYRARYLYVILNQNSVCWHSLHSHHAGSGGGEKSKRASTGSAGVQRGSLHRSGGGGVVRRREMRSAARILHASRAAALVRSTGNVASFVCP